MKVKKDRARLELHNKCWAEYNAREANNHIMPRCTMAEKIKRLHVPATPIQIWRFAQAPQDLQALSTNGGDEDWVALVPAALWKAEYKWIPFLQSSMFGPCDVDEYTLKNGDVVLIGCHA